MTPEERYAALVEALVDKPDVTCSPPTAQPANRFGSGALKFDNRIFAMLVRDRLVVKLPRQRVDALVASAAGVRYDPRHDGRVMKEWLVLEPTSEVPWLSLAIEALEFVASKRA